MDIKSKIVPFEQLSAIAFEALAYKGTPKTDPVTLRNIGRWYYDFINSDNDNLSLQVPVFNESLFSSTINYLFYLDLLLKLLKYPKVADFTDTCLFDIFNYNSTDKKKNKTIHLDFEHHKNDVIFFSNNTIVSSTRFLPLFIANQVSKHNNSEAISNAFHLFRAISKQNIISYPILIDLEKNLSLFASRSLHIKNRLLLKHVASNTLKENLDLDNFLTEIEGQDIKVSLTYKYPYNNNVTSRLFLELPEKSKRFELIFRKRFHYNEINTQDIVLTKGELYGSPLNLYSFLECFTVIDTNHNSELYFLIKQLTETWRTLNYNPYKVPFPAKWFSCINNSENLLYWENQYKKDFPSVNYSTLEIILKIIKIIYDLDWNKHLGNEESLLVLPKSNLFPDVTNSLANFLAAKYKKAVQVGEIQESINGSLAVFDPYNTNMLADLCYYHKNLTISIVIPDFLYYQYQPYLKYHLAKYVHDATTQGSRQAYDPEYALKIENWNHEKLKILKSISKFLHAYKSKYVIVDEVDEDETIVLDIDESTNPLIEEEVIELVSDREQKANKYDNYKEVYIKTINGFDYYLKPNAKVLIEEKGFILSSKAFLLNKGMSFLPTSEISRAVDRTKLLDKMSTMPKDVLNWKNLLFRKSKSQISLFNILEKKGLSILQSTFQKDYLESVSNSNNEFHLPRRYHDWEIICEYLGISDVAKGWNLHKCRGNINALKDAYSNVIAFLNESEDYGSNIDDEVIEKVALILDAIASKEEHKEDRLRVAKSVITEITKNLDLQEITIIKHINYEK